MFLRAKFGLAAECRVRIVGVDENGLGPRLGPLVATAVTFEAKSYEPRRVRKIAERAGIGDSKATAGFGSMAHTEGVALALVERLSGQVPRDVDELLDQVGLDGPLTLREPCPRASARQCWSSELRLPAFGGDAKAGRASLARLARAGLVPVRARSAVSCVRVFNREVERRGSKLSVDLELFERLLLDARAAGPTQLEALCGMVGGIRKYTGFFGRFDRDRVQIVSESRAACEYLVPEVGRVRFEVDCDATHPPVGLASMLGKYMREVLVERQNAFYRAHDAQLPRASGYHDPVTARFVTQTAPIRARLRIVDGCFERTS